MQAIHSHVISIIRRFWPALLIAIAWIWLFGPMMAGQTVCGFRDSAYWYYPLFKWIDAQWASGVVPLWNPYCNLGVPVVADGTSSVFYPGKLVFCFRFLSFASRYGIYLAIHVPIAAAGTYWFARILRANQAGATLAAVSFAFGGCVLFQTTNVVYLVSAAWLPFALGCIWMLIRTNQIRWSTLAGVFCALMILGGDPQMVYHVGLICVASMVAEFFRRKRRHWRSKKQFSHTSYRWILFQAAPQLMLLVLVTSLLSAIQLIPTYEWSKLSERINPQVPSNVYQVLTNPEGLGAEDAMKVLIGEPVLSIDHAYQFSQPPWSLMELLVPNISGKPFPRHQRWSNGLPGADRMWVPSLYMGLATVVLALASMRFWGRSRKRKWLTCLTLFFCIASFGWYGVVWIVYEFLPVSMHDATIGCQVGGLYWLMNMVLPKYFAFRYPAKLFVVASLGISLLAGVTLRDFRLKQFWAIVLFAMIGVGIGIVTLQLPSTQEFLARVPPDIYWGPFDIAGATAAIQSSMVHALVILVLLFIVAIILRFLTRRSQRSLLFHALVLLTLAEVCFANSWLVPQVPVAVFEAPTQTQQIIAELKSEIPDQRPVRVYRSGQQMFELEAWKLTSSDERLSDVVQWQRESLHFKHHLSDEIVLLGSHSSIEPRHFQQYINYFEWDLAWATRPVNPNWPLPNRFFDVTVTFNDEQDATVIVPFVPDRYYDLTSPAEWMYDFDPQTESEKSKRFPECLWVSRDQPVLNVGDGKGCRVKEFGCNRMLLEVQTEKSRMLAIPGVISNGWKARVKKVEPDSSSPSNEVDVLCSLDWVNAPRFRYAEGLLIPFAEAGTFEVELEYSPASFWIGMWISVISWVGLILVCIGNFASRKSKFFVFRNNWIP